MPEMSQVLTPDPCIPQLRSKGHFAVKTMRNARISCGIGRGGGDRNPRPQLNARAPRTFFWHSTTSHTTAAPVRLVPCRNGAPEEFADTQAYLRDTTCGQLEVCSRDPFHRCIANFLAGPDSLPLTSG